MYIITLSHVIVFAILYPTYKSCLKKIFECLFNIYVPFMQNDNNQINRVTVTYTYLFTSVEIAALERFTIRTCRDQLGTFMRNFDFITRRKHKKPMTDASMSLLTFEAYFKPYPKNQLKIGFIQ